MRVLFISAVCVAALSQTSALAKRVGAGPKPANPLQIVKKSFEHVVVADKRLVRWRIGTVHRGFRIHRKGRILRGWRICGSLRLKRADGLSKITHRFLIFVRQNKIRYSLITRNEANASILEIKHACAVLSPVEHARLDRGDFGAMPENPKALAIAFLSGRQQDVPSNWRQTLQVKSMHRRVSTRIGVPSGWQICGSVLGSTAGDRRLHFFVTVRNGVVGGGLVQRVLGKPTTKKQKTLALITAVIRRSCQGGDQRTARSLMRFDK